MLLSMLLALSTAQATEVGHSKTFGLGLQAGVPATFTGKYWVNDKGGVAFHIGAFSGLYLDGRIQVEQRFYDLGDWSFAHLGLYWDAGVITRLWTTTSGGVSLGPTGGVGAEMRFHTVPAAVFAETNFQYYLLDAGTLSVAYTSGAGGRWYF
jgi:hypothetical protein